MQVVLGYFDKSGQALAEPHGDLSVHVYTEGLEAFLETTHGVVLKSAGVLAQVHASNLRQAQATHRDETWRRVRGFGGFASNHEINSVYICARCSRFLSSLHI